MSDDSNPTHLVVADEGGGEWSVQAWYKSEDEADRAANALKHLSASAPEQLLPSYVVNCHSCGAKVELFPNTAPAQSPRVCVKCGCEDEPSDAEIAAGVHRHYCKEHGCRCEFPASVPDGGVEAMRQALMLIANHEHDSTCNSTMGYECNCPVGIAQQSLTPAAGEEK